MKKVILILTILLANAMYSFAQNNASETATQTVQLQMSNALEITFTSNNTNIGDLVSIPFTTVNDYANGVESGTQEIKVRSNKNFNVNVKSSNEKFYVSTGSGSSLSSYKVEDILTLKVISNQTSGNNQYSSFKKVKADNQTLLSNCSRGGNQTFTLKYKADPGFDLPAGTYSTTVVYTATQQ